MKFRHGMLIALSLSVVPLLPQLSRSEPEKTAPARLKVLLPAEARLSIDENPTRLTGPERLFDTPPLPDGKAVTYTLRWVYRVKDQNIIRMTLVTCHAGRETLADLRPDRDNDSSWISYVPTPRVVVERMLELAEVTSKDVVFDLGCGDGRIVATAAQKYGARGVGIDIDPARYRDSIATVKKAKVEDLVEIRQGDALKVPDLSRATVVTTYMLYEFQRKLEPILKKELPPGARIVAHDFEFKGWPPEKTVTFQGPEREHVLYVYRIGGKK